MCGTVAFTLRPREQAAVLVAAVVFSPVLIVGALGFGAYKGVEKVVTGIQKSQDGRRIHNALRKLHKQICRGLGQEAIGQHIADLTSQLAQNNENWPLYLQRACLYFIQMDYSQAAADLNIYLVHFPDNVVALMLKGHIDSAVGDYRSADEYYKQALEYVTNQVPDEFVEIPTTISPQDIIEQLTANKLKEAFKMAPFVSESTSQVLQQANNYIKLIKADEVPASSYYNYLRGVISYALFVQDERNKELLTDAQNFLTLYAESPEPSNATMDSISPNDRAAALSLLSQVYRLKHDDARADELLTRARQADPNVFFVDHTDKDQLRTPWPMPELHPKGAKVFAQHDFQEYTFHKPTWCKQCNTFVVNWWRRKDYLCRQCGARVHADCKDRVTFACTEPAHDDYAQ